MEKPLYPSLYMRITQGYNKGTHSDSYAIDDAGKDQGISSLYAPFTGVIKKVYPNDANEVWLESLEPVEYPDGTIDYMTILFAHCNNIDNLFVGKIIKRGEAFYSEGTKGNATGNHCHIECGKGKFTGTGWYKNKSGYYSINNGKKPEECLWIDDSITIVNNQNYNFKKISYIESETEILDTPASSIKEPDKSNNPQESVEKDIVEKIAPIFTCAKDDLYGIYLKKGQQVYIK